MVLMRLRLRLRLIPFSGFHQFASIKYASNHLPVQVAYFIYGRPPGDPFRDDEDLLAEPGGGPLRKGGPLRLDPDALAQLEPERRRGSDDSPPPAPVQPPEDLRLLSGSRLRRRGPQHPRIGPVQALFQARQNTLPLPPVRPRKVLPEPTLHVSVPPFADGGLDVGGLGEDVGDPQAVLQRPVEDGLELGPLVRQQLPRAPTRRAQDVQKRLQHRLRSLVLQGPQPRILAQDVDHDENEFGRIEFLELLHVDQVRLPMRIYGDGDRSVAAESSPALLVQGVRVLSVEEVLHHPLAQPRNRPLRLPPQSRGAREERGGPLRLPYLAKLVLH